MEKYCQACGMPLTNKDDFAGDDENSNFCHFCVDADGGVKPCEEIFEGGVQFFLNQVGGERAMAEKVTRKNMRRLAYWQGKECPVLQGEVATDEEFAEALKNLD